MSNILVVGTGYWGKNLVRNFSELEALYGVCDTDVSTLERMKGKYPVCWGRSSGNQRYPGQCLSYGKSG